MHGVGHHRSCTHVERQESPSIFGVMKSASRSTKKRSYSCASVSARQANRARHPLRFATPERSLAGSCAAFKGFESSPARTKGARRLTPRRGGAVLP